MSKVKNDRIPANYRVLCKIRYGSQIGELDHIRATYDPTFKIRAQTKPFVSSQSVPGK